MGFLQRLFGASKGKGKESSVELTNLPESAEKESSVKLTNLPAGVSFPNRPQDKIYYDASAQLLFYKGVMPETEKNKFLKLSEDIPYKRAIKSLFLKTQKSNPMALWAGMFLYAGTRDENITYDRNAIELAVNKYGMPLVEYFSDALSWNPKVRNKAEQILNIICESHAVGQIIANRASAELKEYQVMKVDHASNTCDHPTIDIDYFEVKMPDGDATCSDDDCSCGFPGARIPRGTGYLVITEDIVVFRHGALSIEAARNKAQSMESNGITFASRGMGVVTPILCCEKSPKLKDLNREVAATDAKNCWEKGIAPLRATPHKVMSQATPTTNGPSDIKSQPSDVTELEKKEEKKEKTSEEVWQEWIEEAKKKKSEYMSNDVKFIVVRQQGGFIDIRCPSCGSKCPSFLQANDPVLEQRVWGADCPSCGRAFNFKVKKE